jgi:folate-dependent tRNA-U54 methylase TrmFO/GidA
MSASLAYFIGQMRTSGLAFRAAANRFLRSRRMRHLSGNRRIAELRCTGDSGSVGGVTTAGLLQESTNVTSAVSEYPADLQQLGAGGALPLLRRSLSSQARHALNWANLVTALGSSE